jgi:hypothetical protein
MSAPAAPRQRPVIRVQVPPVEIELLDAKVTIIEVHRYETPWTGPMYHVACTVEWGGYRSQVFFVDAKDNEELEQKLKVEIAKMKLMVMTGYTAPLQRIA